MGPSIDVVAPPSIAYQVTDDVSLPIAAAHVAIASSIRTKTTLVASPVKVGPPPHEASSGSPFIKPFVDLFSSTNALSPGLGQD